MTFSKELFLEDGFIDLGEVLDKNATHDLLEQVYTSRDFSSALFIDEEQHRKNPRYTKTNPGPGINFTEKVDLSFIEENPSFRNAMTTVLGPDYNILLKKFVVGVPDDWIPDWVIREISGLGATNLGSYIKPEFHDITFFHGIDFHQDLVDHPKRKADFVTLYVYLDNVIDGMSPLVIVPKSHIFGATTFPHKITVHNGTNKLTYEDRRGRKGDFNFKFLTGGAGNIYFWSQLTLHGTQPQGVTKPRISLRYQIERGKNDEPCLIDEFNNQIDGPLLLESVRYDQDESGKVEKRGNMINNVPEQS